MPKTAAMARTRSPPPPLMSTSSRRKAAEIDLADAELPAFLTEGDAAGLALNGASAP